MTEELKPVRCGCGGPVICIQGKDTPWKIGGMFEVHCLGCGISTKLYDTEAEAVEAWNRAMGASAEPERIAKVKHG